MSFYDEQSAGADKNDFPLIPEGKYKVMLNAVKLRQTPNKADVLSLEYKLENNRRCFQNFRFDESGSKWARWQLGTLGVLSEAKKTSKEGESVSETMLNVKRTIDSLFIGKVFSIELTHRKWTPPSGKEVTVESVRVIEKSTKVDMLSNKDSESKGPPSFDSDDELPF